MIASYITTFFLEHPTSNIFYIYYPFDVAHDLVSAAFRVLRDGDLGDVFNDATSTSRSRGPIIPQGDSPPGIVKSFIRRFIIGLPLVGATSVVQMFLTAPVIAPVQWMARWRGSRNRRNRNSQDVAAVIIIGLLVVGTLRSVLLDVFITNLI